MAARCLFGIFVFGSNSDLIYRFATEDLLQYLRQCFKDRGYIFTENERVHNEATEEVSLTFDDAIVQHLSILRNFHANTSYRNSAIKRITLRSNMELFFDKTGSSNIICMADDSFNDVLVLKAINLFKSLIRFHLGALPFKKSEINNKIIDRISSSLQYYLNHVKMNQALVFESCEYLYTHNSPSIPQRCLEACTIINQDVQSWFHTPPTVIMIICKDVIVYMYTNDDQSRPSNSDIFLLMLNNTSRSLRDQFESQQKATSNDMAHIYKLKVDHNHHSQTFSSDDIRSTQTRRTNSLPTLPELESINENNQYTVEVVFMKTSNRSLAPFTLYTIPLTDKISVLILVEWKASLACSNLSELIRQLDLLTNHAQFSYSRLSNHIKPIENNATIRSYFQKRNLSTNTLSHLLNQTRVIFRSLPKKVDRDQEYEKKVDQIFANLGKLSNFSVGIFNSLFFESEEYFLSNNHKRHNSSSTDENNPLDSSSLVEVLREKLTLELKDWFSFIEAKSQRNITMGLCHNDFSGLVHFALIDRLRGRIYTPTLYTDDNQYRSLGSSHFNSSEQFLEKKIINFELECLAALQRGCTAYTKTDEYFTYNYTLRLQESNGASMRLYKPFLKSDPPGILYNDFYKTLAYENYSSMTDQPLRCFELICVHLRFVPSSNVRDQCEQLWPKLMELEEHT